jgi:hypothetical protein
MYIKCWGARGASPVSGKQFLKYGGNTTCIEVRAGDPELTILIDFGSGAPAMGRECLRTNRMDLDVLITHTHWDHINGFPLFPLLFVPGSKLRFHYNPSCQDNPEQSVVQDLMAPPHFPVEARDLSVSLSYCQVSSEFQLGPVKSSASPCPIPTLVLDTVWNIWAKALSFLLIMNWGFSTMAREHSKITFNVLPGSGPADSRLLNISVRWNMNRKKGFGHSMVQQVLDLGSKVPGQIPGLFPP